MVVSFSIPKAIRKGLVDPHLPLILLTLVSSILLCLACFDYNSTPLAKGTILDEGADLPVSVITFGVLGFCYQSDENVSKVCSSPQLGYNIDALHDYSPTQFSSWTTPISKALVLHIISFCFYSLEVTVILISFFKLSLLSQWLFEITLCVSTTALGAFVADLSLFASINAALPDRTTMAVERGTWYSLVSFLFLFLGACIFKSRSRNILRVRSATPPADYLAAEEGRNIATPPPTLPPPPEKDCPGFFDMVGDYGYLAAQIDTSRRHEEQQKQQSTTVVYGRKHDVKSLPPIPVSPQDEEKTDIPLSAERDQDVSYPISSVIFPSNSVAPVLVGADNSIIKAHNDARLSNTSNTTTPSSTQASQSPISTRSIPSAYPPVTYNHRRRANSTSSSLLPINLNLDMSELYQVYMDPAWRSSACLVYTDRSSTATRKSTGQSSVSGSSVFMPARASSVFMNPAFGTRPPSRYSDSLSKKPSTKSQRSRMSTPRTPFVDTFLREFQGDYQGALLFFPSLRVQRVPETEPMPELPKFLSQTPPGTPQVLPNRQDSTPNPP